MAQGRCLPCGYAVLADVSVCCPPRRGRLPMYSSPVRHWNPKIPVRLACIRHAASVHPEPGSNSPLSINGALKGSSCLLACFISECCLTPLFDVFLFSFQCSGHSALAECSLILSSSSVLVKPFFHIFYKNVTSLLSAPLCACSRPSGPFLLPVLRRRGRAFVGTLGSLPNSFPCEAAPSYPPLL